MSKITIVDLEVSLNVGVSEEERAKPQRTLLTVDMEFDFSVAAMNERLSRTIDYYALVQRLMEYVTGRQWKLIETLATELADVVLSEFKPEAVYVEVKKFAIPQARYVSVSLVKARAGSAGFKRPAWGAQ